jgi:monovalent cation/proton antiporter MnhG/PhaG subunit
VTISELVVAALLTMGVLTQLLCCLGVLLMPHLYDRLHFVGPASSLGAALVAAAVVVDKQLAHEGIVAVLIALFTTVFGPVLTHATARAARIREHGDWRPHPEEKVFRT